MPRGWTRHRRAAGRAAAARLDAQPPHGWRADAARLAHRRSVIYCDCGRRGPAPSREHRRLRMSRPVPLLLVLVAVTSAGCTRAHASAEAEDTEAVLAAVQRFLDTMATQDVDGARTVLVPEGRFFAVVQDADSVIIRSFTNEEYLADLPAMNAPVERIWDPEVRVHGNIASVWTPYDFHRGGEFSHCGFDAFTLVKAADGWRITGGVYTVERVDCPDSPLGPPDATGRVPGIEADAEPPPAGGM
jgi:hypothetical protein